MRETGDNTALRGAARLGRHRLFPEIEPYAAGRLAVAPPHALYWEESGNPDGAPALYLHGGPGAGLTASARRFFDPAHYRLVAFDQRGAGKSAPAGELAGNDLAALVADIEALREECGVARWLVFGGSWGALLALAYAKAHPDRCTALVLRGVFLGGKAEIDWFLYGMRQFFPDAWRAFANHIPAGERGDLLAAYHKRLTDPDPDVHLPAARAWSQYEAGCSALIPRDETLHRYDDAAAALGLARIEAHYFVNGCFLNEGALLAGMRRIADIPGAIVQGRYDMVCPPATAEQLARAWPKARFDLIPDAGHSALERGIATALVAATERFKKLG
jgi:proline iminopeptidase